jgi:methylated-DNA-[protein]-cysteine S-methyltransferase
MDERVKLETGLLESPLGGILLAWRGPALVSLDYQGFEERFDRLIARRYPDASLVAAAGIPAHLHEALDRYFAGDLAAIDDLEVNLAGTDFEERVWRLLRTIAAGTTATYGELAARLGIPNAARAVGRANSMNPVAIVVPCHRVIGASGKLTGYAGGLERKRWLLQHEFAVTGPSIEIS